MSRACEFENGEKIFLFGQEVDACVYKETERHENVDVIVSKCKRCGSTLVEWKRRPETVSYILEEETE